MIKASGKISSDKKIRSYLLRYWQLYLLLLPVIIYYIIFLYLPMYGIQIAFKNFIPRLGFAGGPWVGLENFTRFFNSFYFKEVILNTFTISFYSLALGFPVPIILALMMNEVRSKSFKKTIQTVTYAPHFISMVVLCSMVFLFLSPTTGVINKVIEAFGGTAVYFMGEPKYFKMIYVLSGIWQNTGYNSIIYTAALTSIDPQIHEAATIDGAGRLRRIWHVNIPGILPTAVILLIMSCGTLMNVGFEKAFLLQNDLNRSASDVIDTLVYKQGLIQADYSYSTAVGLFNSLINCFLLVTVNFIARKVGETSL